MKRRLVKIAAGALIGCTVGIGIMVIFPGGGSSGDIVLVILAMVMCAGVGALLG